MSEKGINMTKKNFANIYVAFVEKMDKEMEAFKASYKNFDFQQVYNDWYTIGFYESYHDMLSCDFIDDKNIEEEILWLYDKETPLAYLYDKWIDSDGAFSHNWDDMLDFIRTVYEEELQKASLDKEPKLSQPGNAHLGKFDIAALMNSLASNAWYGTKPTKMCMLRLCWSCVAC